MQRLYVRENCPDCHYVQLILKKRVLVETELSKIMILPAPSSMSCTPTLVDETGKKYEGMEVKKWLRHQVEQMNYNAEEVLNPHHSEFHRGNKRFLCVMLLLIYLLRMKC